MKGCILVVLMALAVNCIYAMRIEDLVNPWPGCPLGPQGPEDDVKLEVQDNCNQFIHCESFGRPQLKYCAKSDPALVFDGPLGKCVWPWESSRDCSGVPATTTTEKEDICNTNPPTTTTEKTTTTTTEKTTTPTTTTTTEKTTIPTTTTEKTTIPTTTTEKTTTPSTTTVQTTTPTTVQTTTPTTVQTTTPTTTTSCPIITCPTVAPVTCPECEVVTCPQVTCPTCPAPEECPAVPNGCDTFFYEHEKSCRKYYECKPKERTCPSKLHFNPKIKMCDKPKNSKCSGKKLIYDLLQERDTDQSSMIYSDGSEPFPGCPEDIDEGSTAVVLEIKNDCQHYMMCVGGKKGIKKECPADLVFDQDKGVCIFRKDSNRTDC